MSITSIAEDKLLNLQLHLFYYEELYELVKFFPLIFTVKRTSH